MNRRDHARRRLGVAAALVVLLASACSDGSDGLAGSTGSDGPTSITEPTETTAAPGDSGSPTTEAMPGPFVAQGTYPVGTTTVDLVDESRDTAANAGAPAQSGRALPTVVFYPAEGESNREAEGGDVTDEAEPRDGQYPLVVFSHGVTARGIFYRGELVAMASAGYVVIAPDYPLSNRDTPGKATVTDVGNQPADAGFLIDQFTTTDAEAPTATVAAHVDGDRVAAIGHSLGAATSLGIGYSACCADARVDAVVAWAGVLVPMMNEPTVGEGITDRPLLLIHGDEDKTVPYAASVNAFEKVESPRWFITLPGAGHNGAFLTPGADPVSNMVTDATVAFLDAELKDDPSGLPRLEQAVADVGPSKATVQQAG